MVVHVRVRLCPPVFKSLFFTSLVLFLYFLMAVMVTIFVISGDLLKLKVKLGGKIAEHFDNESHDIRNFSCS